MYAVLVVKAEGKRPLGKPRGRWRVVVKWFLKKYDRWIWSGFMWFRIDIRVGLL
jgi:hypothetical protein